MNPYMPPTDLLAVHARGYHKLARELGIRPQSAISRTFGALNARNLLYLQAELTALELALRDLRRC